MQEIVQPTQVEVSENILKNWQNILDIIAEMVGIPTALIMRLVESDTRDVRRRG